MVPVQLDRAAAGGRHAAMQLISDGPDDAPARLLLAHGAGAGMDSAWLDDMAGRLGAAGIRVVRFEFPYMAKRRAGGGRRAPGRQPVLLGGVRAALAAGGPPVPALGGKSMGGRMASLIADAVGAPALVCLGFPFHAPGRPPGDRIGHLEHLATPTLVVQGTRDPFGTPDEVAGYRLSPSIALHWIADGDHDLKPRRASGRSHADALAEAAAAVAGHLQRRPGGTGAG